MTKQITTVKDVDTDIFKYVDRFNQRSNIEQRKMILNYRILALKYRKLSELSDALIETAATFDAVRMILHNYEGKESSEDKVCTKDKVGTEDK
jgi:hypothetical protein